MDARCPCCSSEGRVWSHVGAEVGFTHSSCVLSVERTRLYRFCSGAKTKIRLIFVQNASNELPKKGSIFIVSTTVIDHVQRLKQ